MKGPVLHLLSQRPGQTGSGVLLDAAVRHAAARGWSQHAVVGLPAGMGPPHIGGQGSELLRPLYFETEALPFPLPGMSDVMPYPSTRFSDLDRESLDAYLSAWRRHLAAVVAETRPRLIHSHHVWLLSALVKEIAPEIPVITSCHATGLRQAELCPELAPMVRRGCARNERFLVLHAEHAGTLADQLGIDPARIAVTGAGYREDLFHARDRRTDRAEELLYVGKFSEAKGLPWLLDAVERLAAQRPELRLHVAGGGGGAEGEALAARMAEMAPRVVLHGMLGQPELAELMRRCDLCVLPSFYEGVPLVLVEAAACGCRIVSTALPGVTASLAPALGDLLDLLPLPPMVSVDRPSPEGLGRFTRELESALDRGLSKPGPGQDIAARCRSFAWSELFLRIEKEWRLLIDGGTEKIIRN